MRLFTGLLLCVAAVAQTGGPVAVELSLVASKAVYKTGEAIQFHLTFTAPQTGFILNQTTTSPASTPRRCLPPNLYGDLDALHGGWRERL